MNLILLAAVAFQSPGAIAASAPLYRQTPPSQVCMAADDLDEKTESCDDNQIFLQAAQNCWTKVQNTQARVTKDLQSQIGANQAVNQNQDFSTSKANQDEAVAAHDYMLKFTETALDNLDKYFDVVVLPEDLDDLSDDEVLDTPCYHDAVVPMDEIAEKMEDKLDEIKNSKGMEASMGNTSATRQSNTNSLNGNTVTGGQGQGSGAAAVKGTSSNPASTITGVQQEKAKQQNQ